MTDQRTDMVPHAGGGAPARAAGEARAVGIPMDQRMAMLREALTNPEVDPAKAQAMAELIWKMEDREREAEFNRAKIAAINAMPAIYKRGENTHTSTRYAKFEDYHRAAMPVLREHGLTLDFRIGSEGRDITVQPILRHENGYIEEGGIMRGPSDEGKGRSAIQAVGSASSYLKRYAMRAMLNIVEDDEDDDGRGGALATDPMNDRRARMVEAAQAAKDEGKYQDWFNKQKPKDRAWLISTGRHAMFGGAPLLPGSTPAAAEEEPEPERRDEPARNQGDSREALAGDDRGPGDGQLGLDQGGAEPTGPKPKKTPRQWVDTFKAEVDRFKKMDDLDLYMDGKRVALERLKESDEALWKECDDAYRAKIAAFLEA